MTNHRHPEVRAQRASKGDGSGASAVHSSRAAEPVIGPATSGRTHWRPPQDDRQLLGARRRLAGFARTLRDNGFRVGLAETSDALAVLASPAALQPVSLKPALRALFCATHSDWERFDEIFDAFWRGGGMRQRNVLSGLPAASQAPARRLAEAHVRWRRGLPAPCGRGSSAASRSAVAAAASICAVPFIAMFRTAAP